MPRKAALPLLEFRSFRHGYFATRRFTFVPTVASPIQKIWKASSVGIPEWAQTAGIYARGFLSETAGVDLRKVHWVQAGMNEAGREEKVEFKLPDGVGYKQRRDTSISAMLLSGARLTLRSRRVCQMRSTKVAAR